MKKIVFIFIILFLYGCGGGSSNTPKDNSIEKKLPFVFKVKTDNEGASSDTMFEIPTYGDGYNYSVDCDNDGVYEVENLTKNYICSYEIAGEYTISISGAFPQIRFNGEKDRKKLISIEQWGTNKWRSMNHAFDGCKNMILSTVDTPNLTQVTDMNSTFANTGSFNGDIGNWDVSNVTDMSRMFSYAYEFNQDIGNWDVSNVTDVSYMFYRSSNFNQNIGNWDVSSVTDMSSMFSYAYEFNQDIGSWDVSKVTDMSSMFSYVNEFNQDIGNWNVSNVTDMSDMFYRSSKFNQDIGNWDVSNVTNMSGMFYWVDDFNQDIGNWDVSSVTDMSSMFYRSLKFNQDIGSWDVSKVTDMSYMLGDVTLSNTNYDSILTGWSSLPSLQKNVIFNAGNSKFTYHPIPLNAKNILLNDYNWTIYDGM